MYVIEQDVFESTKTEIMKELRERSYQCTEQAINKIMLMWFERKSSLFEILSKHPNWNPEKLMIQFDADYTREFDNTQLYRFTEYLFSHVSKEYGVTFRWNLPNNIYEIICFIQSIYSSYFNDSYDNSIARLNNTNEGFKLRNNMKASKAIGKICKEMGWDQFPDYHKEYAKVCDALNPIRVKRHTCISLNPLDYLLMSHGNSWSSCHYIDDAYDERGCYSNGTICYMLDKCSFVFYTVHSDYDGEDIELQPKLQRQMFGYSDEMLFQSRLYPQSNDDGAEHIYKEIREIVQKVVADCLEKPNLWKTSHSAVSEVVFRGDYAVNYEDWRGCNPGSELCRLSVFSDRTRSYTNIIMGEVSHCIYCGGRNHQDDNIDCCHSYSDYVECECCGDDVHIDDAYYINGNYYCEDCVTECACCGTHIVEEDNEYVDGYGYVCSSCYANRFETCDYCGNDYHIEDLNYTEDGCKYCSDCVENNAFRCDKCGDWYHEGVEKDGYLYCPDCYEEIMEEERLEEEGRLLDECA